MYTYLVKMIFFKVWVDRGPPMAVRGFTSQTLFTHLQEGYLSVLEQIGKLVKYLNFKGFM